MAFVTAVFAAIFLLLVPVIIYCTFTRRLDYYSGIFFSAFSAVVSLGICVFLGNIKNGVRIIDVFIDNCVYNMKSVFNAMIDILKTEGATAEEIEEISRLLLGNLEAMEQTYRIIVPAIIILTALLLFSLIFAFIKWIMVLSKADTSTLPSFADMRLAKGGVGVFMLSYILPMFIKNSTLSAAFANMYVIIGAMAGVCGFSYIDFRLKQKISSGILRFLIYIIAFSVLLMLPYISTMVFYVLMFMGLFDSVFNYRLRYIIMHGKRKE